MAKIVHSVAGYGVKGRQINEMTIGALAKVGEVGVETVRYYQRRGFLAAQKLEVVQARLRDLQRVRRALAELIERCDAGRQRQCPIIESLARQS